MDGTGEWIYVKHRLGDLHHKDTISDVQLDQKLLV